MVLSIASGKNCSEEKAHKLYITLECMLEFEKEEEKEKVLALMRRFFFRNKICIQKTVRGNSGKRNRKSNSRKT
jgi:hypothetical protein